MLTLAIPDDIRTEALRMSKSLEHDYQENRHSIMAGTGHYYAKIGELMLARKYGWAHADNYDYDLLAVHEGKARRIDVKVKRRTVAPRKNYLASVAAANTKQKCDYYLFCSTYGDETLYVIGMIPKTNFFSLAIFREEGEPDPDSPPGQNWKFRADCFNLPYSCLPTIGKEPLP